jgi:hypothetical protein
VRRGARGRGDARRGLRRARGGARRRQPGRRGGGARGLTYELLIRPATTGDAPAIARLLVDAWRAGYAGLVPQPVLDGLDTDERAARWSERIPERTVLVAGDRDALTGVASLAIPARDLDDEPGAGELTVLYVHPDRWRRGVGGDRQTDPFTGLPEIRLRARLD